MRTYSTKHFRCEFRTGGREETEELLKELQSVLYSESERSANGGQDLRPTAILCERTGGKYSYFQISEGSYCGKTVCIKTERFDEGKSDRESVYAGEMRIGKDCTEIALEICKTDSLLIDLKPVFIIMAKYFV